MRSTEAVVSASSVVFGCFGFGYNEKTRTKSGGVARTVITRAEKGDDKREW